MTDLGGSIDSTHLKKPSKGGKKSVAERLAESAAASEKRDMAVSPMDSHAENRINKQKPPIVESKELPQPPEDSSSGIRIRDE